MNCYFICYFIFAQLQYPDLSALLFHLNGAPLLEGFLQDYGRQCIHQKSRNVILNVWCHIWYAILLVILYALIDWVNEWLLNAQRATSWL